MTSSMASGHDSGTFRDAAVPAAGAFFPAGCRGWLLRFDRELIGESDPGTGRDEKVLDQSPFRSLLSSEIEGTPALA